MHTQTPGLTPPGLAPLVDAVRDAAGTGRRVAPRGAGRWWPDPPDDADLLPAGPDALSRCDPADLVATAGAGLTLQTLDTALARHGLFLALDPPGPSERSLGGVLGAGGGGPLAAGFGPPRDQVLGLTVVAGNGTVFHSGGRVVKNVAGFDLAKVVIGGHGGFGVIAEAHLRLRARPAADATRGWCGPAEAVLAAGRRVLAAGCAPAACEIVDPHLAAELGGEPAWTLLARALGSAIAVDEELAAVARAAGPGLGAAVVPAGVWTAWRVVVGACPVLLRVGGDPDRWDEAARLAAEHTGPPLLVSVTAPRGTVRVGLRRTTAASIAACRDAAARRGWPVTLERAPAWLRGAAGVWGGLPAATERLARALRHTFDPDGVLAVPLWSDAPAGGRAGGQ